MADSDRPYKTTSNDLVKQNDAANDQAASRPSPKQRKPGSDDDVVAELGDKLGGPA